MEQHFPARYANQLCYEAVNQGSVVDAVVSATEYVVIELRAKEILELVLTYNVFL